MGPSTRNTFVIEPTQTYKQNFIFFSCHFPPRFRFFAHRLKEAGINVLGIGEANYEEVHPELKEALSEYYRISDMECYDQVYRAVGHFAHQHGRIHYFEAFNEHWVEMEGKIRRDFNIPGYLPDELDVYKRKSGMKDVFLSAGLDVSPGILPQNIEEATKFAAKIGYPFIIKPDKGVGAVGAKKINDEAELKQFWQEDYFLEKFIFGDIETFDGFTDQNGEICFQASTLYSAPLMEVLSGDCESMYYFIRSKLPDDLVKLGTAAIKAFNLKARFFHLEVFRTKEGNRLLPLEINLRPPGVINLDMWNFAYRQDVYSEYAKMITGKPVTPLKPPCHYCVYTARRNLWVGSYVHSHEEILTKLGKTLELQWEMPKVYSGVMGDYCYVFTCDTEAQMRENIKFVEERRK